MTRLKILTILNHSPGTYINKINNNVIMDILLLNELFITIFSGFKITDFSFFEFLAYQSPGTIYPVKSKLLIEEFLS